MAAPTVPPISVDLQHFTASGRVAAPALLGATLREHGACDISFGLPGLARFRVNIFIQRGSCAVVMRVIPTQIPDCASLRIPQQLADVTKLRDGIVLVTGPAGSGKSSTLA